MPAPSVRRVLREPCVVEPRRDPVLPRPDSDEPPVPEADAEDTPARALTDADAPVRAEAVLSSVCFAAPAAGAT